jgi:hypothetical protein
MWWLLLTCILLLCLGCAGFERTAQTLHEQGVMGCFWASGMYPPFVSAHGIIATGGATLADCDRLR